MKAPSPEKHLPPAKFNIKRAEDGHVLLRIGSTPPVIIRLTPATAITVGLRIVCAADAELDTAYANLRSFCGISFGNVRGLVKAFFGQSVKN